MHCGQHFLAALAIAALAACGESRPPTSSLAPGQITAHVFAGAPIKAATVAVVAVDDATGAALSNVPILGTATTDEHGTAVIPMATAPYDGPVQLVAHGTDIAYADPSDSAATISLPTSAKLTSYLVRYRTGDSLTVPVTLWTSLADAAALAYSQGRNVSSPSTTTLSKALAVTDSLFTRHLSQGITWDLRKVVPISIAQAQSLRDAVLATLADVGLNQLARDISTAASLTPGQVVTAPTLLADLTADLAADGRFDGRGAAGQLQTAGTPPYAFAANTTRFDFARALDRWVVGPQNKTGLTRGDLQTAGIHDAISLDASLLYPGDQPARGFDNAPPAVAFAATFVAAGKIHSPVAPDNRISGTVTIVADASDPSGVASLALEINGNALEADPKLATVTHFIGPFDTTKLTDGAITISARVADKVGNAGTATLHLTVDNTPPTITVAQPTAHSSVRPPIALDASATDVGSVASLVASATATGVADPSAITDTDPAPERFQALAWAGVPGAQDGATAVSWMACDAVGNCSSATTPMTLDTTGPLLTVVGTIPEWLTANDIDPQGQYRLTVAAVDPTGVAVVTYTLDSGGADLAMTSSVPGQYSALLLADAGTTTVLVTATDTLGNRGTTLRIPLRRDTVPPTVLVPTTAYPSYYDEAGLAFASAAPGAAYVYADQTKRAVVQNLSTTDNPITKVATRLSWAAPGAAAPGADALETTNPENTPLLYVQIPMASTDSPLSSVTYAGTLTNSNLAAICYQSAPSISGSLMRSALHSSTGTEIYFLPLAMETLFPSADARTALANCARHPYQISLTITATDAAGNQGFLPYTLLFAVDGPPLVISEDTSYSGKTSDGTNPRAYSITDGTYAQLYTNNSRFTADPYVRAIRYQVANPGARPVTVTLRPLSAKWTSTEQWDRLLPSFTGTFVADGFTYDAQQLFSKISNPPCGPEETWPCSLSVYLYHSLGNTSEKYRCTPNLYIAGAGTPVWVPRTVVPRIYASANGTQYGETAPLAITASGSSVIPPGGYAVVYVTRPFAGAADRDAATLGLPALTWSAPVLPGTGSTWNYDTDQTIWYKSARSYYFIRNSRTGVVNCDTSTGSKQGVKSTEAYFYLRRLTVATEVLSGMLYLDTAAGDATGPEIGTHSYSYQLNRTLAH